MDAPKPSYLLLTWDSTGPHSGEVWSKHAINPSKVWWETQPLAGDLSILLCYRSSQADSFGEAVFDERTRATIEQQRCQTRHRGWLVHLVEPKGGQEVCLDDNLTVRQYHQGQFREAIQIKAFEGP